MKMLECFPTELAQELASFQEMIFDIRLFVNRPCVLNTTLGEMRTKFEMDADTLYRTAQQLCENRLRVSPETTGSGFITLRGGHRMGLCGRMTYDQNSWTMREIGSVCIRVAQQKKGCGQKVVACARGRKGLQSVLIAGAPGSGKTTMLRDVVRILSDGGVAIGLCDERSEIAACVRGVPQLDVGRKTHVLDGCSKIQGLLWLLRSLSPQLLAMDELGNSLECKAVLEAAGCGVPVIATAHATNSAQLCHRSAIRSLLKENAFSRVVFLREHKVAAIKSGRQVLEEGCGGR